MRVDDQSGPGTSAASCAKDVSGLAQDRFGIDQGKQAEVHMDLASRATQDPARPQALASPWHAKQMYSTMHCITAQHHSRDHGCDRALTLCTSASSEVCHSCCTSYTCNKLASVKHWSSSWVKKTTRLWGLSTNTLHDASF
jgi:hypothetical protein